MRNFIFIGGFICEFFINCIVNSFEVAVAAEATARLLLLFHILDGQRLVEHDKFVVVEK